MQKRYQIFITDTSQSGGLSRLSVSAFQLKIVAGIAGFLLLCLCVFAFDYTLAVSKQTEVRRLRQENKELNRHLQAVKEKVIGLESSFKRVEDFSYKLKSIMNREAFVPSSAIGPLPLDYHGQHRHFDFSSEGESQEPQPQDDSLSQKKGEAHLFFERQLTDLEKRSHVLQKNIWSLIGVLDENRHLMSVTPSLLPAKGRITSRFGFRNYPVLSSQKRPADFHRGLDIASKRGQPVIAPADAVVSETGYDSSTGNYIILSHGYDLETLYGHLDNIAVKTTQKVGRGTIIGQVGSTGRSTGPHLHYEVRISGQPVNPEYYILDSL